jgi:hypothetical protein
MLRVTGVQGLLDFRWDGGTRVKEFCRPVFLAVCAGID